MSSIPEPVVHPDFLNTQKGIIEILDHLSSEGSQIDKLTAAYDAWVKEGIIPQDDYRRLKETCASLDKLVIRLQNMQKAPKDLDGEKLDKILVKLETVLSNLNSCRESHVNACARFPTEEAKKGREALSTFFELRDFINDLCDKYVDYAGQYSAYQYSRRLAAGYSSPLN